MIFKNKQVVVVGAATGIGAALAALLRAKGATVVGMIAKRLKAPPRSLWTWRGRNLLKPPVVHYVLT